MLSQIKVTQPKRTEGELSSLSLVVHSTAYYCRSVARNFSSTASCDASDRSVALIEKIDVLKTLSTHNAQTFDTLKIKLYHTSQKL